jgi:HEAT repeat protein
MIDLLLAFQRIAVWLMWAGVVLALGMLCAVVAGRVAYAWQEERRHRFERHYGPLVARALEGDHAARHAIVTCPQRYHFAMATLLITPLIDNRDPRRIAVTRALVRKMTRGRLGDRYLRSRFWWRRALALRAFGLLQRADRTHQIIAALDDGHPDVRGAALDALADMHDPAALPALVTRLYDASLQRGRRAAALAAYGSRCEALILDLAREDEEHRVNFARALAICGTGRSRPTLCHWTGDARPDVCAAAFEALAHVGLDDVSAALAISALESRDAAVREMAAGALRGWEGAGDAASHLAQHLDDTWGVAVKAARSLQSMHQAGRALLESCAGRPDLAGVLSRQMLWEGAHT